ncbi:LysR family transcriptional regulator ArgP [Novosphingobium aerophilum]|nr:MULTISPECIES: LysR family transcriptional regulator ArgP [unclassified Novosphingobium]TCM41443.1 LysR family transcriptional regulator (chromosome initiation inhibitor) [Novosphingobium sp. ST904]
MQMKHCFIMLDYPALAAVSAVIREGTFERAAEALNITPSAVSQRVRGLEERLGAVLIVRGQPCEPTELGATLRAHFDRVQLLEADLQPHLNPPEDSRAAPLTVKLAVNSDSLATWFPEAAAAFVRATGMLLDLTLDDEAHTADRLRSGEVHAVVTSDPEPVQGCRTIELGSLRYRACASPEFIARHFGNGIDPGALAKAPLLRFERRDTLQARWAFETHGVKLAAPTHWVPSTQGFVDFALRGLGWGMHPAPLTQAHIAAGTLQELPPGRPFDVKLYWTVTRIQARSLRVLTDAVRDVAAASLITD